MRLKQIMQHPLAMVSIAVLVFALVQTKFEAHAATEQALLERQLVSAQIEAVGARHEATRSLERVSHADSIAKSLTGKLARAVARADGTEVRLAAERADFAKSTTAAPDTCREVVEKARIALASASDVAQALRSAVATATERGDSLQLAIDSSMAPLRRLVVADSVVGSAATAVVNAMRPSFLSRFVPKLGVGAAVGIDALYHPNVVIGLTLGWKF